MKWGKEKSSQERKNRRSVRFIMAKTTSPLRVAKRVEEISPSHNANILAVWITHNLHRVSVVVQMKYERYPHFRPMGNVLG